MVSQIIIVNIGTWGELADKRVEEIWGWAGGWSGRWGGGRLGDVDGT